MMPVGTGGFVDQLCVLFSGGKDSKLKSTSYWTMVYHDCGRVEGVSRRGVICVATTASAKNSKFGWFVFILSFLSNDVQSKEWYSFQMYVFSTYLKFGYCLVLIPKFTNSWFTWLRVYVYISIYMKDLSHHICKAYHNIISTWAAFHSGVADWHRPSGFGSGPSNHDLKRITTSPSNPEKDALKIRSSNKTGGIG